MDPASLAPAAAAGDTVGASMPSLNRKDANYLSSIQELNEDTITSLRHFLATASMVPAVGGNMSAWLENNIPGDNLGFGLQKKREVCF